MDALDGNAIAGLLHDVFGAEMTTATGACGSCGATSVVAELTVYRRAPSAATPGARPRARARRGPPPGSPPPAAERRARGSVGRGRTCQAAPRGSIQRTEVVCATLAAPRKLPANWADPVSSPNEAP